LTALAHEYSQKWHKNEIAASTNRSSLWTRYCH